MSEQVIVKDPRRTGATTRAMLSAPVGAIYVWCNKHLDYPKALARSLGRDDLRIVSPDWLRPQSVLGLSRETVCVTDHAFWMMRQSDEAVDNLYYIEQRNKGTKRSTEVHHENAYHLNRGCYRSCCLPCAGGLFAYQSNRGNHRRTSRLIT